MEIRDMHEGLRNTRNGSKDTGNGLMYVGIKLRGTDTSYGFGLRNAPNV
jgi:hypothetical protein